MSAMYMPSGMWCWSSRGDRSPARMVMRVMTVMRTMMAVASGGA